MHNENSRVKIPALIHLARLGYNYFALKNKQIIIDPDTNILINILTEQLKKLNPGVDADQIRQELQYIKEELNYDDLGRAFL